MRRELADEILALIEARPEAQPTAMEFEMAYQARIAMDRIRFAIKHTEQFAPQTGQMREAGFQLLDALRRLESVDRRFQARCRVRLEGAASRQAGGLKNLNGQETRPSHPANGL